MLYDPFEKFLFFSQDLELKEYQFRASCRKKRAELVTEIKQLQDPAHSVADDDEQRAEVEAAFNADLQKWISLQTVSHILFLSGR